MMQEVQQLMERGINITVRNSILIHEPQIRKRNFSLGQQPRSNRSLLPHCEQVPSYRRHRVQAKVEKFKALKAATKAIQDSLSSYNALKKEVTSKSPNNAFFPAILTKKDPKLFIRNLGIDIKGAQPKKQKPLTRLRSKTEGHSPCKTSRKGETRGLYDNQKIQIDRKSTNLTVCEGGYPKKYKQLSLEQIVEQKQEGRYLLRVLGQFCGRQDKPTSRRTSDDYSLDGW